MADRTACWKCGRSIALRPTGELYPHGPRRECPGGRSASSDTAWRMPRRARRIETLVTTGGLL